MEAQYPVPISENNDHGLIDQMKAGVSRIKGQRLDKISRLYYLLHIDTPYALGTFFELPIEATQKEVLLYAREVIENYVRKLSDRHRDNFRPRRFPRYWVLRDVIRGDEEKDNYYGKFEVLLTNGGNIKRR